MYILLGLTAVAALIGYTAVLVLVTLALMWSLAGDVADARSAKRLYPLFAGVGVLGGMVGNLASGPLVAAVGAPNLLVLTAAVYGRVRVEQRAPAATTAVPDPCPEQTSTTESSGDSPAPGLPVGPLDERDRELSARANQRRLLP